MVPLLSYFSLDLRAYSLWPQFINFEMMNKWTCLNLGIFMYTRKNIKYRKCRIVPEDYYFLILQTNLGKMLIKKCKHYWCQETPLFSFSIHIVSQKNSYFGCQVISMRHDQFIQPGELQPLEIVLLLLNNAPLVCTLHFSFLF